MLNFAILNANNFELILVIWKNVVQVDLNLSFSVLNRIGVAHLNHILKPSSSLRFVCCAQCKIQLKFNVL